MRVLQIMASGARGGGADHLLGLLPELRALGVDCHAALDSDGPTAARLRDLGFDVSELTLMRSRLDAAAPYRIAQRARSTRPDILHYHGTRAAFFGALARPLMGPSAPAAIYTAHGLSYRKQMSHARRAIFLAAEALACRGAAEVVSVSRADLEDLHRRRFVAPGCGIHIPNAVDTARFFPGDRVAARKKFGLSPGGLLVMTVSRLVPQKSVGDLIDAIGHCAGATLVIVGDGPQRAELAARANGFADRVTFLGGRDDVPELLRAADLFVLSSRWEGEPIALLEALASGLPCVATATAGAREILDGSEAGVIVDIGQPQALAKAIETLAADPGARRRMAEAGERLVANRRYALSARRVAKIYSAVRDGQS